MRLPGYDYSAEGLYFLTICASAGRPIFGAVAVGGGVLDAPQVALSPIGQAIDAQIRAINSRYGHLKD